MSKPPDKVSRVGRSRFQQLHRWMRPRSGTIARHRTRDSCTPSRSHPINGALLHAAARRPLWLQPFGLARILAHDFVAHLVNIRDIHCGELRVLSQNRASASRVSLCYGLLAPLGLCYTATLPSCALIRRIPHCHRATPTGQRNESTPALIRNRIALRRVDGSIRGTALRPAPASGEEKLEQISMGLVVQRVHARERCYRRTTK